MVSSTTPAQHVVSETIMEAYGSAEVAGCISEPGKLALRAAKAAVGAVLRCGMARVQFAAAENARQFLFNLSGSYSRTKYPNCADGDSRTKCNVRVPSTNAQPSARTYPANASSRCRVMG